jgi:hypothetical protein
MPSAIYSRLTAKQKAYIQRLGLSTGRSKGREIVPIDLGLYRELMHLEIVVDKGRRLALTELGQELCRMLSEEAALTLAIVPTGVVMSAPLPMPLTGSLPMPQSAPLQ